MIRKPPAGWQQPTEGTAVRAVRTASTIAKGSAEVARRGQLVMGAVICFLFAAIWGFAALASGLGGSLPSLIGISAMAALAFWSGWRMLKKANAPSG